MKNERMKEEKSEAANLETECLGMKYPQAGNQTEECLGMKYPQAGNQTEECPEMKYSQAKNQTEECPEMKYPQVAYRETKRPGMKPSGTVYLVGAGPGDEGLITVRGQRLLEEADAIIYDHLANPILLEYAKKGCEKIYAGKQNRHHTMRQEEINELLAQKARQYKTVVRLKGGDVYVFGRGGEEGIYLEKQGIPFQVVPGVSSAIAGPAYGGIPITHRGISRGFQVITAHNQDGQPACIDFDALAKSRETCIFLMGLSKLDELARGLIQAGKSPSCPAAVISNATLPNQRTCVGTLETIGSQVRESALTPPALIVAGDVVNLRPALNFFERRPYFGRRYLVTKVGREVSFLTRELREQGAYVTEIQTGEIEIFPDSVKTEDLSWADWIVLTSRHGVEAFFASLKARKTDIRALAHKKFAVVGKKTAQALEEYGIYADLIPSSFHSQALTDELERTVKPEERIVYGIPAGTKNLEIQRLKERYSLRELCLYENREWKLWRTQFEEECRNLFPKSRIPEYDCAFFTCASSVYRFLGSLREEELEPFRAGRTEAISIGENTTKALEKFGVLNIRQASVSTYEGMLRI